MGQDGAGWGRIGQDGAGLPLWAGHFSFLAFLVARVCVCEEINSPASEP